MRSPPPPGDVYPQDGQILLQRYQYLCACAFAELQKGSISPPSLIPGSPSNEGDVSKENGDKARGLDWQLTLHVHHAFFVHFFAVTAGLQRENT